MVIQGFVEISWGKMHTPVVGIREGVKRCGWGVERYGITKWYFDIFP